MFIDKLNENQCWNLWIKIHNNPVKIARKLFPDRPKNYVKVTKLIGSYCSNKGTALGLADNPERRNVYTDIADEIYPDIPDWGRSLSEIKSIKWL